MGFEEQGNVEPVNRTFDGRRSKLEQRLPNQLWFSAEAGRWTPCLRIVEDLLWKRRRRRHLRGRSYSL